MKPCPHCNGCGSWILPAIAQMFPFRFGNGLMAIVCMTCNGTGKVR